ncbi:MraY family glycosyltransferase [Winogradskyella immobilis]|uniref:UDP-N-acetylmuramyl pentapeptide phosphotransferase/UDP-N-acetylglucosamine-1-phosphate transferase n=1 Tax=Winogradskyella immobilis TaxID=2816852 RepID=A0ABS8EK14_9FLAO|nr:hypothetical protein [Winogradskyella immobilis]MCC1483493.1 hypothetical protein [Winogradskyella immobilis]MCG0015587.1 hypothetical protein [Winogradskyella immobilis]
MISQGEILRTSIGIIGLSIILFIYIRIAKKLDFTIQLKNSKKNIILGAGIIFPLSYSYSLLFFETFPFYLSIIVFLLMIISFIDDLKSINVLFRLSIQILCVSVTIFLFYENLLTSIYLSCIIVLIYVGYINSFNFMDGINGMLASYTFITILALLVVNNIVPYMSSSILGLLLFSTFLFLIGNFKKKPFFISGDVGSICLGYIIGFIILKFYLTEANPMIFLLIVIYLIDTGITMCINIVNKQNILKAHREHLYEKLVFIKNIPDLKVSLAYSIIQILISVIVIYSIYNQINSIMFFIVIALCLVLFYVIFRALIFGNEFKQTKY